MEALVNERTKQLNEVQKKLIQSEKMAAIGFLSAGIAHEINNPLNYITGGMSGLKKTYDNLIDKVKDFQNLTQLIDIPKEMLAKIPNNIKIEKAISDSSLMFDAIDEGINKTLKIMNDMKSFSNISEDRFDVVTIDDVIDNVISMFYNLFQHKVEIVKNYDRGEKIYAIPSKIQQILRNLLLNAIQAISEEGIITIKTQWNTAKDIYTISIKDNGCGIPKDSLKHIYAPFYTTKEVGKGMGVRTLYSIYIC